jgi:carbonic anhydrase
MRQLDGKVVLITILALTAPLWAKERTGVLLSDDHLDATQEQKAIKKEQDQVMALLKSGNLKHMKHMAGKVGLPRVLVVSCADSHVAPEDVFHLKPGEIYTNRALGNTVDKVMLGSLEYGAEKLKARVLVVMGHTGCTALKEAIAEHDNPLPSEDLWRSLNMKDLIQRLEPAVDIVEQENKQMKVQTDKELEGNAFLDAVVKANVLNTMRTIREQSPTLWSLENDDLLRIVGCIYHKDTGKVEWLKE